MVHFLKQNFDIVNQKLAQFICYIFLISLFTSSIPLKRHSNIDQVIVSYKSLHKAKLLGKWYELITNNHLAMHTPNNLAGNDKNCKPTFIFPGLGIILQPIVYLNLEKESNSFGEGGDYVRPDLFSFGTVMQDV